MLPVKLKTTRILSQNVFFAVASFSQQNPHPNPKLVKGELSKLLKSKHRSSFHTPQPSTLIRNRSLLPSNFSSF